MIGKCVHCGHIDYYYGTPLWVQHCHKCHKPIGFAGENLNEISREIKFRGKRVDTGEWVYGTLVVSKNTYYIVTTNAKVKWLDWNYCEIFEIYRVVPETVGQYIEMKDRTGKETFDGDIIKLYQPNGKPFEKVPIAYIFYHRGAWRVSGFEKFPFISNNIADLNLLYEIVGNIHDNPELFSNEENEEHEKEVKN